MVTATSATSATLVAPSGARVAAPAADLEADGFSLGGLSGRRIALLGGFTVLMLGSLVLLLPTFADLPDLWRRVSQGDASWLAAALAFKIISFGGYTVLFRSVGLDGGSRLNLRVSLHIALAGHAATRLLASAGAGGVALTAWAMRRSGMERRDVAARMVTFLVLLYSVYMVALVVGGLGLATGVLPGGGSPALALVPAAFGGAVIAIVLAAQRLRPRPGAASTRLGRARDALVPVGDGVREARRLARAGNPGLLGALVWWAGDIAVLAACFTAFGDSPAMGVLVFAYFVGMLANTLPLPGGIGGVDGGMVAALAAFGVDPGLAILAVLAYRGFAFWLPIIPGAISYFALRRTVAGWAAEDAAKAVTAPPAELPVVAVLPVRPVARPAADARLCAACPS